MRPLNALSSTTPLSQNTDVIPAELQDYSGQVYNNELYSHYTVSVSSNAAETNVQIIAQNLISHQGVSGLTGYWVGVGINKSILDKGTVYKGFGDPVDTDLGAPIAIPEFISGNYGCYYFDVKDPKNTNKKAYIVVIDEHGRHHHYNIDLELVTTVAKEIEVEPIAWSQISIEELKNDYLFGIDLSDAEGNPLPDSLFAHYLNAAIEYFQNLLDITISELEMLGERHDYIRNDYQNWGYMQLSHNPVKEVKGVRLMYGNRPSVDIPLDWVQLNKLTGQITLFPAAGSASSLIIGQTGMLFGFQSYWDYAPELWEVDYVAGIDPNDKSMPLSLLKEAIFKRASCGALSVYGDLIEVEEMQVA